VTEAEWLAGEDPAPMLEFHEGKASDRRLRLFACGVCRRREFRTSTDGTDALSVAEDFADGLADEADLVIASEIH
jgi:hypothetical protein